MDKTCGIVEATTLVRATHLQKLASEIAEIAQKLEKATEKVEVNDILHQLNTKIFTLKHLSSPIK